MKTRIATMVVIAIVMIQYTAAQSGTKFNSEEKKVAYATRNLISALHSDNNGVIESAMRMTAQIKMRYPATDVTELVSIMSKVSTKHPSGAMRYKAYIAVSVCENPEWYAKDTKVVTADNEKFFHAASDRLQEQLLSANSQ